MFGGGAIFCETTLSRSQVKELERLYPVEGAENERGLERVMSDRNLLRTAAQDGMRLLATIAKHCDPGEDPVKKLVRLLAETGHDVGMLGEWVEDEDA